MDIFHLDAIDGASIRLCRWLPADAPRGVLLISHGLSEHGERYVRFAERLCRAGFVVYAHDHRGHGPEAPVPGWFAATDGWARLIDDLDRVRAFAVAQWPGLPLTLFGHSMGSFIARSYVQRHGAGIDCLVLSATGYRQGALARVMRGVAGVWGRVVGVQTPSRFMAKLVFGGFNLTFRPRRTVADWLSRDPAEVDRYLADPLCAGLPTPGLWRDLFGGVRELETGERLAAARPGQLLPACRVLLVAGSRDPVSLGTFGLGQLARRYRAAGVGLVDMRVYRGGRHEMHHETNREDYLDDLQGWLTQHGALAA
jgi:alpha-beta hydrolase superfamily lysophospholipase